MAYTIDQFGELIKSKYPDYKDINNNDLVNKILEKYPDYKEQVDMWQTKPIDEPTTPVTQLAEWAKWLWERIWGWVVWAVKWAYKWLTSWPSLWETFWSVVESWRHLQRTPTLTEWAIPKTESVWVWDIIKSPIRVTWAAEEFFSPVITPINYLAGKVIRWALWAIWWWIKGSMDEEQKQALWTLWQLLWSYTWNKLKEANAFLVWKYWQEEADRMIQVAKDAAQWVWAALEVWTSVWASATLLRWAKNIIKWVWAKKSPITWETINKWEQKTLSDLWQETKPWVIEWQQVEIPVHKKWVYETITKATWLRTSDPKVLAGRAVSPRTLWKSDKMKLVNIANIETRTKQFYNNVRLWKFEWSIDTLEATAQTMVNNIDKYWEKIWEWVKKLSWWTQMSNDVVEQMTQALESKWASVSPATWKLQSLIKDTEWPLTWDQAFDIKKSYWNEVNKLYKAWDAWTKQYKALSDWVEFLNKQIEKAAEEQLWKEFKNDKILFKQLKDLVSDVTSSALVEWRRSPQTLAEQLSFIEMLQNPVSAVKNWIVRDLAELNTRWWSWKELIKIYDEQALKWVIPPVFKWGWVGKDLINEAKKGWMKKLGKWRWVGKIK